MKVVRTSGDIALEVSTIAELGIGSPTNVEQFKMTVKMTPAVVLCMPDASLRSLAPGGAALLPKRMWL